MSSSTKIDVQPIGGGGEGFTCFREDAGADGPSTAGVFRALAPAYKYCPMCAMELVDGRDGDGDVRRVCPACEWIYFPHNAISTAGVLVSGDSVLLVRRRHEPFPGSWIFPAGFTEYGEHPEDAVVREVREETGLTTRVVSWLGAFTSKDDAREPGHLALFFLLGEQSGTLANNELENLEVRWFPKDQLWLIEPPNHALIAQRMLDEWKR